MITQWTDIRDDGTGIADQIFHANQIRPHGLVLKETELHMDMSKRAAVAVSGLLFAGAAALAVGAAIPANAEVKIGAPMDHDKSQSRDDAQRGTNARVNGSLKRDDGESTEDAKENAGEDAKKDAKENAGEGVKKDAGENTNERANKDAGETAGQRANRDADENSDEDDGDDITSYRSLNELLERGLR